MVHWIQMKRRYHKSADFHSLPFRSLSIRFLVIHFERHQQHMMVSIWSTSAAHATSNKSFHFKSDTIWTTSKSKCYKTSLILCRFQSLPFFRALLLFLSFPMKGVFRVSNKPKTFSLFVASQICWQKNANLSACSEAQRKWKKKNNLWMEVSKRKIRSQWTNEKIGWN